MAGLGARRTRHFAQPAKSPGSPLQTGGASPMNLLVTLLSLAGNYQAIILP